jgi:2-polyprenyl-3-methyl-5-hydroxy-6-metoxy-1,4-benzoquinol methylase
MYHKQEKCLCCDSSNLELLLDLNKQPLANSYHNNKTPLPEYPLGVNLCKNCYHIQLTHIVNPDLLFKDYLYVSGTSQTMRDHFEWFSKFVMEYSDPKSVLDIACNDGSQLDCFKSKGVETFGIDPAENLYSLSSKNHNVICDYFNGNSYDRKFDVIIAQNVFAHNEKHKKFLDDCSNIMHDDSYLFIQTSQAELIQNNQFDTVYHEHISFFNSNSMNELAKRTDLNLIDIIKTSIHGISYLFVFSKKNINKHLVENLIDVERLRGLLSDKLYTEYKQNVKSVVIDFKNAIQEYKDKGFKIVGYGAAAKGMTFLNFADVVLDVIIDDNPLKQNLYTPGTNILIKSANYIKTYGDKDKILYVPLAWNFYSEIRERILKVRNNKNDLFLKYFPTLKIEK